MLIYQFYVSADRTATRSTCWSSTCRRAQHPRTSTREPISTCGLHPQVCIRLARSTGSNQRRDGVLRALAVSLNEVWGKANSASSTALGFWFVNARLRYEQ